MIKINEIKDKEKFPVIELSDNSIININYSTDYTPSLCSTCDYNKSHIVELHLYFNDDEYERIDYIETDNYMFSESDLILFFVNNINDFKSMTKDDFIDFISNEYNLK